MIMGEGKKKPPVGTPGRPTLAFARLPLWESELIEASNISAS